ncbi:MAG: cobalamin-binding protein [Phycisphaerales bacterium]
MTAQTPACRVVSLLPSATEALCAVGGEGLLVGRSHECDFPPTIGDLPVLTAARTRFENAAQVDRDVRRALDDAGAASLYTLDEGLLGLLQPDVILTQDLCSVCSIDLAAVERVAAGLAKRPRVVSLNPLTFEAVLDDLLTIGAAVDSGNGAMARSATETVVRLRERVYAACDFVNAFADGPSVAFLEWTDPLFVGGHWVPQMIERAGGRCPLNATRPLRTAGAAAGPIGTTLRIAEKSIVVPPEVLVASRPERIIIAPCGLSLAQARREAEALREKPWWRELPAVQTGHVAIVDGNQYFSRPGPRLVEAFEWLVGWLSDRPEVMPEGFAWEMMRV